MEQNKSKDITHSCRPVFIEVLGFVIVVSILLVIAMNRSAGVLKAESHPIDSKSVQSGNDNDAIASAIEANDSEYKNDLKKVSQEKDTIAGISPLPFRQTLVENMQKEDLDQTIANLANSDDYCLVITSESGLAPMWESPDFAVIAVTRFARVRRLMSWGRDNSEPIKQKLRDVFRKSLLAYPELNREFSRLISTGKGRFIEPHQREKAQQACFAATYILSELGDREMLPLLVQQYRMHQSFPAENNAPVPPCMTFYAMHRIVTAKSWESLSPEANRLLAEYIEVAKEHIAPITEKKVTVWDSQYSEYDPLLQITGLRGPVLERQKPMTMPVYPIKFQDGSLMQNFTKPSKRLDMLFGKLEAFVQAAYPVSNQID